MADIRRFIRPDLVGLGAYSAHKLPETVPGLEPGDVVKLDANENPYGCSPDVYRALAAYRRYSVYPDAAQTRLRSLIENYAGIGAEYIVASNGSGELLDDILNLLLEPGDEVINCLPTFDMYRLRTLINRGRLVNVPRNADFSVNIEAVKDAITPRTRLIIMANPNNPTGNPLAESDILALLETGVPVLIDEAYYEFCGETVVPLVKQYSNLMVLRTFSKWAGLAGLRVGYAVVAPDITGYLMKIKLPYNVNVAALVAVEESLRNVDYLMANVRAIIAERERLYEKLSGIKYLRPYPSRANFIFCTVLEGEATALCGQLEKKGILVRYFDQPLVKNGLRVSVGTPRQTGRLIEALLEIRPGG